MKGFVLLQRFLGHSVGFYVAPQKFVAATANRVTAELTVRRNGFVAALADEVFIAPTTVGGQLEQLAKRLQGLEVPIIFSPSVANER